MIVYIFDQSIEASSLEVRAGENIAQSIRLVCRFTDTIANTFIQKGVAMTFESNNEGETWIIATLPLMSVSAYR